MRPRGRQPPGSHVPLKALRPPQDSYRVLFVMIETGTGLSSPVPHYQVRHSCGQWTAAEGNFCSYCAGVVTLPEEVASMIVPRAEPPPRPENVAPEGSFANPIVPDRPAQIHPTGTDFNNDPRAISMFKTVEEAARRMLEPPPIVKVVKDQAGESSQE